MAFGTTQADNASTPVSSVYVPNTTNSDMTPLEGYGPINTDSNTPAQKSAPASVGIKDGNNASFGAKADTAATSDTGTFSFIALFKRSLQKFPTIGAQTTSNSLAVNVASDQVVPVKRSTIAVFTQASGATSGSTQNSADLTVGPYREISIDINTTAQSGTSPTIQYFYERKGADNIYYVLWQSAVLTAATNTLSTSIGAGMAYNQSLGLTGRLRWVVGGSATPTFTHSLNIYGK